MIRGFLLALVLAACGSAPKPVVAQPAPVPRSAPDPCSTAKPVNPKVSPQLEGACFGTIGKHEGDRLIVEVLLAKSVDLAAAKQAAEHAVVGAKIVALDDRALGGIPRLRVWVATATEVGALAAIDGVDRIEPMYVINPD